MEKIYENQNPLNCRNASYLIGNGWPFGFGSRIHMEGFGLSLALNVGRVYLYHPDGDNLFWETINPYCLKNGQNNANLGCFYESFSKCTIEDALFSANVTSVNDKEIKTLLVSDFVSSFRNEGYNNYFRFTQIDKLYKLELTKSIRNGKTVKSDLIIPLSILPILNCVPLKIKFKHFWWEAILSTYIIRPNKRTLKQLDKLNNKTINYEECISTFVRHGDKGVEMKLLNFSSYSSAVQLLWNNGLVPESYSILSSYNDEISKNISNIHKAIDQSYNVEYYLYHSKEILSSNGTLFLTTDDELVIKEANSWGKSNNWNIQYTNLFDRSKITAALTWHEKSKLKYQIHDNYEYMSILLNLYYSLKCEAWVCTMMSNSCRIIDELRSTIGAKANRIFADINIETCPVSPPCLSEINNQYTLKSHRENLTDALNTF